MRSCFFIGLLAAAVTSTASAGEAYVPQAVPGLIQASLANAMTLSKLAQPVNIPVPSAVPSSTPTDPQRNVAVVSQTGYRNNAVVTQTGGGNSSYLIQQGTLNHATITQRNGGR